MEKASRAIRRSGVKLLSLQGGHADLNMLLSEMKDIRHSAKLLMNAQHLASQDMMKWAANEENRAIQDVISQVAELNLLWTEVQKIFIEQLKEYRHMFEKVLEGEKRVADARSNLNYCEEKETKVKKECKRVAKRATASELRIFETKVSVAEKSREMAHLELTERLRENEAIKLIQMKSGMLKISEAYIEMSSKCNVLFTAQKTVVHQIPDVHTQELETIKYTGAGTTRYIVQKAREKIEAINQPSTSEPPPPYTPPEPGSGLSSSSGGTPQPAPRRSGARDSHTPPVSDLNLNHETKQDHDDETKIVLTHKIRVRIPDKPGLDDVDGKNFPHSHDYESDGYDDDDQSRVIDAAGDQDNVPLTNSKLYPTLERKSADSSPKEKGRPVPAPRPRLSNSSDTGTDPTNKPETKLSAENLTDETNDVTNEAQQDGKVNTIACEAKGPQAKDDVDESQCEVKDAITKSCEAETKHCEDGQQISPCKIQEAAGGTLNKGELKKL